MKAKRVISRLFIICSLLLSAINSEALPWSAYSVFFQVKHAYTGEILMDMWKEDNGDDKKQNWLIQLTPLDSTLKVDPWMWSNQNDVQIPISKKGGRFILTVSMDGYFPYSDTITIKPFRGTMNQHLPTVFLRPIPKSHSLGGVMVKATKVKFLYKGDTLVYNADAFNTAEGSMLDALIRQLPGVELKDDGQIFVNGRLVESLLLNGKPFFHGNNQIMLDNLPAYMVKDVKVYEREHEWNQLTGIRDQMKEYVMDVGLKKEYQIGWIGNVEGGLGTKDRYLGRLFALRFTPQSRLALYGNINNLNDNRKPGENTNWTPDKMPSGLQATKKGGIDYRVEDRYGKYTVSGNAEASYINTDNKTRTTTETYLTGASQYGRNENINKSSNFSLSTYHNLFYYLAKDHSTNINIVPSASYNHFDRRGSYVNALFD